MQDFRILEKLSHLFAIKWADEYCSSVEYTSKNTHNFIALAADVRLEQPNFNLFIEQPSDIEVRRTAIQTLENTHKARLTYPVRGINGTTYLLEEIVHDESGDYVSVFTEITALARQRDELSQVSNRLSLVLEGTRLGMWDWNPQTNDVVFDERWADMLGVTLSDLTQTLSDWQDRVHPDDIDECFKDIQAHVDGHVDFYENTHRMMHADGTWRYILDRGKVVQRDSDGNPTRFTGTHTDVTALKHAEAQALHALSVRNTFFARMSHEIRTPLHGILGTADHLSRKRLPDDVAHHISNINKSGELLKSLIDDILDISKLEEDALRVVRDELDVIPILKNTFLLFEEKALSKNLIYTFHNVTEEHSVLINIDKIRLNQILSNLLSNALKFTDAGHVTLAAKIESERLLVSVSDSGIGIEDTHSIFNPYVQEGTAESKTQGTGLGLAIVKALCDKLDIALTVTSHVGTGTVFNLVLGEVIRGPRTFKQDNKRVDNIAQELRKCKVLVVDDNEINTIVAKTLLEEHVLYVDVTTSGRQAIKEVQANRYDIIFMDVNMPEMDGVETTKKIEALALPHSPIIIAQTADAISDVLQKFVSTRVKHVITKPFCHDKLVALLSKITLPA